MLRKSLVVLAIALAAACSGSSGPEGPQGPQGPTGPAGPAGDAGTPGAGACPGLPVGQTPGLTASVTVSKPANGTFFAAGEQPVLTIAFANNCGTQLTPAQLTQAELYVYGPRSPNLTITNVDLLNVPYAPFGAYSNLKGYPDGGPPNLTVEADGTITYKLNPITIVDGGFGFQGPGEIPGTYSAGVWSLGPNTLDQNFALADFQIGTATVETYVSGPADGGTVSAALDNSTCFACHKNDAIGGKTYMAHIAPGFSPVGNYALDSLPIGSCKSCHNNHGYSPYTIMHKAHAAHRGEHQLAPGVPHPDYGYVQPDTSLPTYLNVGFPLMPIGGTPGVALTADVAMEKNCTACHVNNVWATNISRAACGSCHDNVFFAGPPDGGAPATSPNIVPQTVFGQPSTGPCTNDSACNGFPVGGNPNLSATSCDVSATSPTFGQCVLRFHPIPTSPNPDTECATCHAASTSTAPGLIAPVDKVHGISQWTAPITLDGYTFKNVSVTGGSGTGGSFNVSDTPVLSFQLLDASDAGVIDLKTNSAWAGTFIVAGPTSNPQRVYGSATGGLSMKTASTGTLTFDGTSTYTYTPSTPWPANALAPILSGLTPQPAPPGSYTVWFYWARTTNGVRDAVDAQKVVNFQTTNPVQARQVVTQAACAACHGQAADGFPHLALHGDQRKNGETCNTCHSQYAQDLGAGSIGPTCTSNTQCGGYNAANPSASWEACLPNPSLTDGGTNCTTTADPTPGVEIDYQKMVHNIHFARLRAGYAERNNLGEPWGTPPIAPATLNYLGFNNGLSSFQEVLSPVDVRSCTNCHQDSKVACSASTPCAYGQTCSASGSCVNVAWQSPTTRACMTCHDSADDAAHAAINTYTPASGPPIETCTVCHASGSAFAVDTVHNITSLYSIHLAYPREP